MTIQLSPEQERVISQAIEAGIIKDVRDIVNIGIDTVRQKLEPATGVSTKAEREDWSRRLHEWIEGHPRDTPLLSDEDISRDSIYGNRGA